MAANAASASRILKGSLFKLIFVKLETTTPKKNKESGKLVVGEACVRVDAMLLYKQNMKIIYRENTIVCVCVSWIELILSEMTRN